MSSRPWIARSVCKGAVWAAAMWSLIGFSAAAATLLAESGSTLLYPLMQEWVQAYSTIAPDVTIETKANGSGAGLAEAANGAVQLGASDAYLGAKGKKSGLLNIALAVSAVQVACNVPEIGSSTLHLTGPMLARVYDGGITYWDDARIRALNPRTRLPHRTIVPIHREDSSGTTFVFAQYLSATDPTWKRERGAHTSLNWADIPGAMAARGNGAVVEDCINATYSLAYIGISYQNRAKAAGLGQAALLNRVGRFAEPNERSVAAAARAMGSQTPADQGISLILAPGATSYPVVNYEYAIVKAHQSDGATAKALRAFLQWVVDPRGGNAQSLLSPVHFAPLPARVWALSVDQISRIGTK